MEEIFDKFNKLVEQMADEVANSDDPKATQEKWDSIIDDAEKQLEVDVEKAVQAEDDALAKEQKEYEDELNSIDDEISVDELISTIEDCSFSGLTNQFTESQIKEMAVYLGYEGEGEGDLKEMVEFVCKSIEKDVEKKDEWTVFKDFLKASSESKFKSEYSEKELVAISLKREKLPDFLKTTDGAVSEKRDWFQKNKNEIDSY